MGRKKESNNEKNTQKFLSPSSEFSLDSLLQRISDLLFHHVKKKEKLIRYIPFSVLNKVKKKLEGKRCVYSFDVTIKLDASCGA
jgi:signal transduction histidine kinase